MPWAVAAAAAPAVIGAISGGIGGGGSSSGGTGNDTAAHYAAQAAALYQQLQGLQPNYGSNSIPYTVNPQELELLQNNISNAAQLGHNLPQLSSAPIPIAQNPDIAQAAYDNLNMYRDAYNTGLFKAPQAAVLGNGPSLDPAKYQADTGKFVNLPTTYSATGQQGQTGALGQMQDVAANGGLTAADQAALSQVMDQTGQLRQQGVASINQRLAAQGMTNSGTAVGEQLMAAQNAANQGRTGAENVFQQAMARQLAAIGQSGTLASNLRGADTTEGLTKDQMLQAYNDKVAGIVNSQNLTNTQNANAAQQFNVQRAQTVSDTNVANQYQQGLAQLASNQWTAGQMSGARAQGEQVLQAQDASVNAMRQYNQQNYNSQQQQNYANEVNAYQNLSGANTAASNYMATTDNNLNANLWNNYNRATDLADRTYQNQYQLTAGQANAYNGQATAANNAQAANAMNRAGTQAAIVGAGNAGANIYRAINTPAANNNPRTNSPANSSGGGSNSGVNNDTTYADQVYSFGGLVRPRRAA